MRVLLQTVQFLHYEYAAFVVSVQLGHFGLQKFILALLDVLGEQVPPCEGEGVGAIVGSFNLGIFL
jgi:hypothetical protein